jgi:hypothetical protein
MTVVFILHGGIHGGLEFQDHVEIADRQMELLRAKIFSNDALPRSLSVRQEKN